MVLNISIEDEQSIIKQINTARYNIANDIYLVQEYKILWEDGISIAGWYGHVIKESMSLKEAIQFAKQYENEHGENTAGVFVAATPYGNEYNGHLIDAITRKKWGIA